MGAEPGWPARSDDGWLWRDRHGIPVRLNPAADEIRRQERIAVEVARREAARQAAAAVAP